MINIFGCLLYMINIGINGFGRIGMGILRNYFSLNSKNFNIVAINGGGATPEQISHNLKYDSSHGRFDGEVNYDNDNNTIRLNNETIKIIAIRKIEELDWYNYDVDIVLECTGSFNSKDKAITHITSGRAKKVLISAPCKNADLDMICGVTDSKLLLNDSNNIISLGSCTTNCLAPIVKVLDGEIGIESGFMTTIHSYTNDQRLLDGKHQDKRRARAANLSIIPTSTGAVKTIGKIIPNIANKIDGIAMRVPTANVSMIDFSFISSRDVTRHDVDRFMDAYANENPRVMKVCYEELVSIDFNSTTYSAIFDATQTKVVNNRLVRVAAWYDNEYGFASRMLDVSSLLADHLLNGK